MKGFLLLVFLLLQLPALWAQGRLQFTETAHHFGKILPGAVVTRNFCFTNTGDRQVVITGVHASCGCTVPRWPSAPVAPGDSACVEVIFNSQGRSGHFRKRVTVVSNAEPQVHQLYVSGHIKQKVTSLASLPVQFAEDTLRAGLVQQGERLQIAVPFRNSGSRQLVLKGVKSSCEYLQAVPGQKILQPHASGELQLQFKPLKSGNLQAELQLFSVDGRQLSLWFTAKVVESLVPPSPVRTRRLQKF